jgi:hypothetical protein
LGLHEKLTGQSCCGVIEPAEEASETRPPTVRNGEPKVQQ